MKRSRERRKRAVKSPNDAVAAEKSSDESRRPLVRGVREGLGVHQAMLKSCVVV